MYSYLQIGRSFGHASAEKLSRSSAWIGAVNAKYTLEQAANTSEVSQAAGKADRKSAARLLDRLFV